MLSAALLIGQILDALIPLAKKGVKVYDLYIGTKKLMDENRVADDPEWDALDKKALEVEAIVFDKSRDV